MELQMVSTLKSILIARAPPKADRGLLVMMYRQMYRRWRSFCELHQDQVQNIDEPGLTGRGTRPVAALPTGLVEQFVADNIEWAKLKVQQRINRIMWGRQASGPGGSSSVDVDVGSDDEYDHTADA